MGSEMCIRDRGTKVAVPQVIASVDLLPQRIRDAANSNDLAADGLAHRLAEAGVLPMFGMPTNVRQLFFKLPTRARRDALSLDRAADQAIAEFAPGSERTWDKRLISPEALSGPVSYSNV